jgi:hypothetical protein
MDSSPSTAPLPPNELALSVLKKSSRALGAGSCLAYDLLTELRSDGLSVKFWWRIATASLVSRFGGDEIDLDGVPFDEDERRNFGNDFFKPINWREQADWAEFFVVDLFRDTYDLAELASGAIVTLGPEYGKYKLLARLPGAKVVPFGSPRHLELWIDALPDFVGLLTRNQAPVLLAEAYLTPAGVLDGQFSINGKLDVEDVKRKNFFLHHYYQIFLHHCPHAIRVQLKPWANFAWPGHPWGQGPLHFPQESWQAALDSFELDSIAAKVRAGSAQTLDLGRRRAELSLEALRQAAARQA